MASDEDPRAAARRIVEQVLASQNDEVSPPAVEEPVQDAPDGAGRDGGPVSEARQRARVLVAEVLAETEDREAAERAAAEAAIRAEAAAVVERERAEEAERLLAEARQAESDRAAVEAERRAAIDLERRAEAEHAAAAHRERDLWTEDTASTTLRMPADRPDADDGGSAEPTEVAVDAPAPPRGDRPPLSVAELAADERAATESTQATDGAPALAVADERDQAGAPGPEDEDRSGTRALEATVEPESRASEPIRSGRWLVASIVGAIALAIIFPLAIRALLQLVALS